MNYPILLSSACVAIFLASCGGSDNKLPLASTTRAGQAAAVQLYNTGRAQESAGQIKKAISSYEEVAEDFPLSEPAPDARFRHASLLDRQGNLIEAFDSYQIYLSKYSAGPQYSTSLRRQYAVAHAVADGQIKNSFLGIKSRMDSKKTVEMLNKVRQNAPRTPGAPLTQFKIGEVWERANKHPEAIAAYRSLTLEYADSNLAPEAQYRIGNILTNQAKDGNQDQANIDRAKEAYQDLLLRYPNSSQAKKARAAIASLGSADLQRSYDVAEFYRKKDQSSSAIFYYREVVRRSQPGALRDQALARLGELGATAQ